MKLTILCVGKCREKYFTDAAAEYLKRLSRYAKTEVIEVKDEKTPEEASPHEEELIRETEGKRLLERLPENAYVICTAIDGKSFDSVGLSVRLSELMLRGESHLCFVIGGSIGLSESVLSRADEKWSFSKLTFPHQLMRVILTEQLYRAFRIMNHEPYHK